MATVTENLVDSQYVWEISTDALGATFTKVKFLESMDMPRT